MELRIDYHFHPNLPKSNKKALLKCKKLWQSFLKQGINCVVVTEHIYKGSKRAFEFMHKTKPKKVYCFPGMEYITKEGVDIVIFSKTAKIYKIPKLKPYGLTFDETVKLIKTNRDLHSYVTHPYTIGTTSIVNILGQKTYRNAVKELGAVEISNGAFDGFVKILKLFPFNIIFKSKLNYVLKTQNLPRKEYPKKAKFLTVGSDAHIASDIGNCAVTESKKDIFQSIVTSKNPRIVRKKIVFNLFNLAINGLITLNEYLTKQKFK